MPSSPGGALPFLSQSAIDQYRDCATFNFVINCVRRKATGMIEMSLVIWKQPVSLYLHILNCQCDKTILSPLHCHYTDISLWNKKYRILLTYLGKWGCERQREGDKAQVIRNTNNIKWLNYLKTVSCHLLLAVFYYITAAHSAECLHVWWSSSVEWPATVVR